MRRARAGVHQVSWEEAVLLSGKEPITDAIIVPYQNHLELCHMVNPSIRIWKGSKVCIVIVPQMDDFRREPRSTDILPSISE